jgi:uncharacterized protein (DUF2062 family)
MTGSQDEKTSQQPARTPLRPSRKTSTRLWRKSLAFLKLKVLHITDTPHRIAMGVAVGVFVAFGLAPFLGTHIVAALVLAMIFGGNKIAAIGAMWVHNPVTMWPIIFAEYELGKHVVHLWTRTPKGGHELLKQFLDNWEEQGVFSYPFGSEFWYNLSHLMVKIGMEVTIGCAILGVITSVLAYFAAKEIIIEHRKKNPHRRYRVQ